ncbi:hypothetical protein HII36_09680 [Nonomuraea sp. NN258]|uniref:hypothetical protein n=1 Tax=Nonomuraea antri TaxID=2730852 RepID=UPI0015695609|nr:hypothetical protein [Nonomuraea antri]NRQ32106.1 hypothetical protein [Nonomuraea antri]
MTWPEGGARVAASAVGSEAILVVVGYEGPSIVTPTADADPVTHARSDFRLGHWVIPDERADVYMYRAAWVPDGEGRDWEEAADIAVDWVLSEAHGRGAPPLVIANGKNSVTDVGRLGQLGRQYGVATPRSRDLTRGRGAVLAYVPTLEALEMAVRVARGSSLCVVEGFAQPMAGWAVAVGAEDLTLPAVGTAAPLNSVLVEALERLVSYGNNGWGDQFGKQQAQRVLADLSREWRNPEFIAGYVIGKGRSARGAKNLQAIIRKLS